jgi:hypothetical protein
MAGLSCGSGRLHIPVIHYETLDPIGFTVACLEVRGSNSVVSECQLATIGKPDIKLTLQKSIAVLRSQSVIVTCP